MTRHLAGMEAGEMTELAGTQYDKVILIAVAGRGAGYLVECREYDSATRWLGSLRARTILQSEFLMEAVFVAARESFAPLGRIAVDPSGNVVLRLRGGRLPLVASLEPLVRQGDVFQPIIRRNDRSGRPVEGGIQAVPWTLLVAETDGSTDIVCRVESSYRRPLAMRRRGRSEQFALLVTSPPGPSRLLLRAEKRPDQVLAGYGVYARGSADHSSVLLGRTDRDGAILVEPAPQRLQVLYVKQGEHLLARLPIVPGMRPTYIAEIPDDPARIRIEGFLNGVQDQLVDLVARREILLARARKQIALGRLAEAKRSLDELQQLPNRQYFQQQLSQQRRVDRAEETPARNRLEQLFQETEQLLVGFLDPRPINDLQGELDRAMLAN
jgi:hypothetical protein